MVPLDPAVEQGSVLVLTCRASGCLHPPTLSWRRTVRNQTILSRKSPEKGLSLLHLLDLDLKDQGEFSCEAECDSVLRTGRTQIQVFCESDTSDIIKNTGSLWYEGQRGSTWILMRGSTMLHRVWPL